MQRPTLTLCVIVMPFHRATCQSRATLRERYEREAMGHDPHMAEAARLMIQLIERLETAFPDRPVWGLTSLHNLKLLATDDWRTPWFVSIALPIGGTFVIDYLFPKAEAPWPDARVRGETTSIDAAINMISVAMQRSGGWKPLM